MHVIIYACNIKIYTFFLCFYTKHNEGPIGSKHVAHFHVFHSVRCELIYKFLSVPTNAQLYILYILGKVI